MRPQTVAALVPVVSALAVVSLAAGPVAAAGRPGRAGAGDPYFPRQGNTGYGVASYDLRVSYRAAPKRITGVATLRARSRQDLSLFTLDLRRTLRVSAVTVDGRRATFSHPAKYVQELRIRPRRAIPARTFFTVVVRYAGRIAAIRDPNGSVDGLTPTHDGAVAVSEPQGSPTWYPVNDTPRDKAKYTVTVSVPKGLTAISNGVLASRTTKAARTTWRWTLRQEVSSYLVTLAIGRFTVTSGRTRSGIPYWYAVDPRERAGSLRRTPAVLDYFASKFGRYPFDVTGGIVEHARFLDYNLETVTRPVYDRTPDIRTLSHELAHQWFGDAVTLQRWRDIWLNEGFAQFAMWLYDEHRGSTSAHTRLRRLLAVPASHSAVWNPPPGNPRRASAVFAGSVYNRGAATLQALREKVGSRTFFAILRGWVTAHRYGNARTSQFVVYASKQAHRNLTSFFHEWLYRSGKPRQRLRG